MFSQEKEENVEVQVNGNYSIVRNSNEPPTIVQGILFKEGHVFKTWKQRLVVVEKGVLSYYSMKNTNIFQVQEKVLKGCINLNGYSIQKNHHEMYLWPSKLGLEGKDLRLHTSAQIHENPYPMKVWVAAIRCHIRYAQETFSNKFDWYPFYQTILTDPTRRISTSPETSNLPYLRRRIFQVVRRDGVNVESEIESGSNFVSFKRFHEFVEVNELLLNLQNDCRGRVTNGEGWVTISTGDGSVILIELIPTEEQTSSMIEFAGKPSEGSGLEKPSFIKDSEVSMSGSIFSFSEHANR